MKPFSVWIALTMGMNLLLILEFITFSFATWTSAAICCRKGWHILFAVYFGIALQPFGAFAAMWMSVSLPPGIPPVAVTVSRHVLSILVPILFSICLPDLTRFHQPPVDSRSESKRSRLQFSVRGALLYPTCTFAAFWLLRPLCFWSPHRFEFRPLGILLRDGWSTSAWDMYSVSGYRIHFTELVLPYLRTTLPLSSLSTLLTATLVALIAGAAVIHVSRGRYCVCAQLNSRVRRIIVFGVTATVAASVSVFVLLATGLVLPSQLPTHYLAACYLSLAAIPIAILVASQQLKR